MNVLFLSPHYPSEMQHFTRGLAEVGARVISVADVPFGQLPEGVRRHVHHHLQIPGLLDERRALDAITAALGRVRVDRVETLWEPLVLLAASLRDRLGAPGLSREQALVFRDKGLMKDRLEAAGLPVPRARRATTLRGVREAAEVVGFPLIVKPISGAGSADTYRCDDAPALERVLTRLGHVTEVSVETFIDGREFTYDTLAIDDRAVFESITQYHPRPLIARSEEWISPAQLTFRDPLSDPERARGAELGRRVLEALGRGTGFSHMEWYLTDDGEVYFGEIGARSGGGFLVDMMNYSSDIDIYREWARGVCWSAFEADVARKYHVGMVFKRAQGQGRVRHVEGVAPLRQRFGPWLIEEAILPIGSPRRDWRQTLISDGHLTVRHPDYDTCFEMMQAIVREVQVYC